MKTKTFTRNNAPHMAAREGNRVRVYTNISGKGPFQAALDKTFATVSAAKAFMANPAM